MNADALRGARNFARVVARIALDRTAVRRASTGDLAVVEGILHVVLDAVTAELRRRDEERASGRVGEARRAYVVPMRTRGTC